MVHLDFFSTVPNEIIEKIYKLFIPDSVNHQNISGILCAINFSSTCSRIRNLYLCRTRTVKYIDLRFCHVEEKYSFGNCPMFLPLPIGYPKIKKELIFHISKKWEMENLIGFLLPPLPSTETFSICKTVLESAKWFSYLHKFQIPHIPHSIFERSLFRNMYLRYISIEPTTMNKLELIMKYLKNNEAILECLVLNLGFLEEIEISHSITSKEEHSEHNFPLDLIFGTIKDIICKKTSLLKIVIDCSFDFQFKKTKISEHSLNIYHRRDESERCICFIGDDDHCINCDWEDLADVASVRNYDCYHQIPGDETYLTIATSGHVHDENKFLLQSTVDNILSIDMDIVAEQNRLKRCEVIDISPWHYMADSPSLTDDELNNLKRVVHSFESTLDSIVIMGVDMNFDGHKALSMCIPREKIKKLHTDIMSLIVIMQEYSFERTEYISLWYWPLESYYAESTSLLQFALILQNLSNILNNIMDCVPKLKKLDLFLFEPIFQTERIEGFQLEIHGFCSAIELFEENHPQVDINSLKKVANSWKALARLIQDGSQVKK